VLLPLEYLLPKRLLVVLSLFHCTQCVVCTVEVWTTVYIYHLYNLRGKILPGVIFETDHPLSLRFQFHSGRVGSRGKFHRRGENSASFSPVGEALTLPETSHLSPKVVSLFLGSGEPISFLVKVFLEARELMVDGKGNIS